MSEKTVKLSQRYEAHGEPFDSVTLREPRFEDLLALGEPYEVQRAAGNNVVIENVDTVAAYVRRCVTAPGIEKLGALTLADARLVRDAVIGFFMVSASPDAK
ncbi:MAG: phage tail assembly protein [Mesorhizobium sp.]|uniref:phage tail assembly protein n=1 Tax=Mesorhizobium sp. TaxID=1871066 RepID=UPI00122759C3|nr:phage tail assembly protein [Mesorhizobium sp.]TIQ18893.1 MAG: phage tail assembly protein [Mesorhizobium sp.]